MIKVLFVCLGNICRSPMAEAIFNRQLKERGLSDQIASDSAGTSRYHIGADPDPRTIDCSIGNNTPIDHKARQVRIEDYHEFDYILAMDQNNYRDIAAVFKKEHPHFYLMREFDEQRDSLDVPDPYFGGMDGFQQVYDMLWRASDKLIDSIAREKNL
jgi:protein-tyrosine phosphatase